MKKSRYSQHKNIVQINITALVDVLLILVAILLLLLPLYIKKLPVDLPKTSLAGAAEISKALRIGMDTKGNLFLDNTVISEQELLAKINEQNSIQLAFDKSVTYEQIAQIIDKISKKNPKQISFIVQ